MEFQRTIAREVSVSGVGVHSGKKATLKFKPAPPNCGVVFERVDISSSPKIPARISNVIDPVRRPRRTSVGLDSVEVHTVEHLMATLSGLAIDNIAIDIDSDEVPCFDGSAQVFVRALKEAGFTSQEAAKRYFQIREPIYLQENEATLMILPSEDFKISYTLSYGHPSPTAQYIHLTLTAESFEREIAEARTFCMEEEVARLRSQGLGKGANYQNTLVLGQKGVIKSSLRFNNEFARHKILDLIGDLYLLGLPLKGHIIGVRSGHPINIRLLQKIRLQEELARDAGVRAPTTPISTGKLDINEIQKILPHRYPFLLVDKIIELKEMKAVGVKNVTINDNFFTGHFPGHPIMPGVMVVEAMAQVAGILMLSRAQNRGKLAYFMSMDKVKFRQPVIPGDQLRMEAEAVRLKTRTGQVRTRAFVENKLVCEADLAFSLVEA